MDENQNIKELLKPRREIAASDKLRRCVMEMTAAKYRPSVRQQWWWGGAACVMIVLGVILLLRISNATTLNDADCVVYVEGKQIVGYAAEEIAEADVAKMEKFMQTIVAQQTEEETKVQEFMNHYNTQNR